LWARLSRSFEQDAEVPKLPQLSPEEKEPIENDDRIQRDLLGRIIERDVPFTVIVPSHDPSISLDQGQKDPSFQGIEVVRILEEAGR